jgi:glycosyltransferase involved in cell wall biosynthesis
MKPRRVLFTTWGEDLATSGILGTQVVQRLKNLAKVQSDWQIDYLCAMPIVWKKRHKQPSSQLTLRIELLERAGVKVHVYYYWLPVRARHFALVWVWPLTPLFFPWFFTIRRIVQARAIQIVHARAYTGTAVAIRAKAVLGLDTRILFDTRGLYVDELLQLGYIKSGGFLHKLWRKCERGMFQRADKIANVNSAFSDLVSRVHNLPDSKIVTIYPTVDMATFRPLRSHQATKDRNARLKQGNLALIYCGDLGGSSYYTVEALFELYSSVKTTFPSATLKIITPQSRNRIMDELHSIHPSHLMSEFEVVHTRSAGETALQLQSADLALHAYNKGTTRYSEDLSNVGFGIKIAEYLATGLPILINSTVRAGAKLIKSTQSGIVFDFGKISNIDRELERLKEHWLEYSKSAHSTARKYFSEEKNAKKTTRVYAELSSSDDMEL